MKAVAKASVSKREDEIAKKLDKWFPSAHKTPAEQLEYDVKQARITTYLENKKLFQLTHNETLFALNVSQGKLSTKWSTTSYCMRHCAVIDSKHINECELFVNNNSRPCGWNPTVKEE